MKVLIVGSGAREHAIAWKIHQDPKVELFAAPGNGGTESFAQNLPGVDITSGSSVVDAARFVGADLLVVGPEAPLACGVVNTLDKAGIPSFGPSMEAAQIETSKSFAIEMMRRKRIPHAPSWFFNNDAAVENFARNYGKPVAVKPDGLSGGKGVQICSTPEEAAFAARACMRISPRRRIVVQEVLEGQEVSVFGFTDGYSLSSLVAACDYKRRDDGNKGPNTGGMGSYAWPRFWTDQLASTARDSIMKPVLEELAQMGTPFRGVLYAGLMLTQDGLKVLEFNCRLGDPETQVILPLLESDLLEAMMACWEGRLANVPVEWSQEFAVGVVLADVRYPGGTSRLESAIGFPERLKEKLFWGTGTTLHKGTTGMRIHGVDRMATVVQKAPTLESARQKVYGAVAELDLPPGFLHFRTDIAAV